MTYELWDGQTRNAIGEFSSEPEALAFIRGAARRNGRASVGSWGLLQMNSRGRGTLVAEGAALVERALAPEGAKQKGAAQVPA